MLFSNKHSHEDSYDMPAPLREGSSSKYEVIAAVKTYLNRTNTQYAIMIDGGWGTGKTYFYRTEIKPLVRDHHTIYISLFGLKSIQDIENEIFKAISFQKEDSGEKLKGILSLNPEILEDVKIGGSGYAIQFLMNQWKEDSGKSGRPFVLCLDDLERWEGNFSVCLSYINKLVEHESAKCIVIGSLSFLEHDDEKEFENARDKTIGHIYKLENEMDVVFNAALSLINFKNNKSSQFIKKLIYENQKKLTNILNRVNCKNIRTLSEAIQLYEYIYNHNVTPLTESKNLAFHYFCSLLATLILFKNYFVNQELRDKLLNGYNSSNQGYAFLDELGYFDEDKPDYITEKSRFLLETIFFRADKISLKGVFSIIKKGFYFGKDFEGDFLKWEVEKTYETYLDTYSLSHLNDAEVSKIIDDVLHSIFIKKEITNPATLLLLAEHLINDINHGVVELNSEEMKKQFISLFKELYQGGLIDKSLIYELDFGSNCFVQCPEVYEVVRNLNRDYIKDIENHSLSNFWLEITNRPDDAMELFDAFKYEPIFSIYYNPQEVIDALNRLTNSQLFELIIWINSRNKNPGCKQVRNQEREQASNIGEYIDYSYQNKYGMKAGHFKNIAKLLMQF